MKYITVTRINGEKEFYKYESGDAGFENWQRLEWKPEAFPDSSLRACYIFRQDDIFCYVTSIGEKIYQPVATGPDGSTYTQLGARAWMMPRYGCCFLSKSELENVFHWDWRKINAMFFTEQGIAGADSTEALKNWVNTGQNGMLNFLNVDQLNAVRSVRTPPDMRMEDGFNPSPAPQPPLVEEAVRKMPVISKSSIVQGIALGIFVIMTSLLIHQFSQIRKLNSAESDSKTQLIGNNNEIKDLKSKNKELDNDIIILTKGKSAAETLSGKQKEEHDTATKKSKEKMDRLNTLIGQHERWEANLLDIGNQLSGSLKEENSYDYKNLIKRWEDAALEKIEDAAPEKITRKKPIQ